LGIRNCLQIGYAVITVYDIGQLERNHILSLYNWPLQKHGDESWLDTVVYVGNADINGPVINNPDSGTPAPRVDMICTVV
jgi:hypothetical protein